MKRSNARTAGSRGDLFTRKNCCIIPTARVGRNMIFKMADGWLICFITYLSCRIYASFPKTEKLIYITQDS